MSRWLDAARKAPRPKRPVPIVPKGPKAPLLALMALSARPWNTKAKAVGLFPINSRNAPPLLNMTPVCHANGPKVMPG